MGLMTTGLVTGSPSKTVLTDANMGVTASNLVDGVLFALDNNNAGAYRRISANTATTLTVATMTNSFSTGDLYGYIKKEFRYQDMVLYTNMALLRIGDIGIKDTSITTASSQTEYTFPTALKKGAVRGVYLQGRTNDSDDNRWYPLTGWHIEPSTAGNTSLIIFDGQLPASRTVKIEYVGQHAAITSGVSQIDEAIHPELAKAAFKLILGNRRTEGAIGSVDGYNQLYNKYRDEFDEAMRRYPVWIPDKIGKVFNARGQSLFRDRGEPNKADLT